MSMVLPLSYLYFWQYHPLQVQITCENIKKPSMSSFYSPLSYPKRCSPSAYTWLIPPFQTGFYPLITLYLSIYLLFIYLFIYLFIFVSMVAAASIGYPAFYSIYYFQQQNNFAERWLYNLLDVHRFELIWFCKPLL